MQQMPKGDCMQEGIMNVTTETPNSTRPSALFSGSLRSFGNWDRHQRMPYMQFNATMPHSVPGTSDACMAPNRKMFQYGSQNEPLEMAIGQERVQFIPTQMEGGFSEADMFLVDDEEIYQHSNLSVNSSLCAEGASVAYEKDGELEMENRSRIEKGRTEEKVRTKDEEGKVEDESEEARALRIKEKNRIAAKICRRRKKEYIRCLEQRVASLEKQNEALLLKLKFFKDIYDREHNFGC